MISLSKPEVILTHESDLDGLVSGLLLQRLAKVAFDLNVPLQAYHYNIWRGREMHESAAWVCDLTFEARLDKQNWVVVDHHPTDLKPEHTELVHDITKAAGTLCYELCQAQGISSPELDRLVRLNNVGDLFLEDDPDFILANDYASLVKVYGFWNLHALIEGKLERLLDHPLLEVVAVKRKVEDPLGMEWSRKNTVEISSKVAFVDTIVGNNNLIIHAMLERKVLPYPVLVTLYRRPNGVVIASLRSRNGEALSVAERLQGGGHPNACGATLPRSVKNIPDAILYLKRVLNPKPGPNIPLASLEGLFDSWDSKK